MNDAQLQMPDTPKASRRLAAILAADIAGYSTLMGADEARTVRDLKSHQAVILPMIGEHGGRIIDTAGDGILAEFGSVVNAVECAVAIQKNMAERNASIDPARRMQFRIGINLGDVIHDETRVYGDGVNIAARLESIAEPGGICVSGTAHEHVHNKLPLSFIDLGAQSVKNIAQAIRVYRVDALQPAVPTPIAKTALTLPDKPSIAVLPFTNLSGDPTQDYFADGVVEEIITALSRVKWFFVIARNSSFTYKRKRVDLAQVGRELGVRYVLEGSVRKASSRVRITCQLIEAGSNTHVWADRYEGELSNIFELQDDITRNVLAAIEPNLRAAEIERASRKPTNDLTAYDLYLQALPYHYNIERGSNAQAIQLLQRAIKLDPSFVLAKAFLAFSHLIRWIQGWSTEEDRQEGVRLARECALDHRDDPETLRLAGHVLTAIAKDYDYGISLLERSISLNPNSAQAHQSAGWSRLYVGEADGAIANFEQAQRLNPLDPGRAYVTSGFAWANLILDRPSEALEWSRKAAQEAPQWGAAHRGMIIALVWLGRIDEAREALRRLREVSPEFDLSYARRFLPYRSREFVERCLKALKQAGLPE